MHAASDICKSVTQIAVLTIIGAQEAEFYSGQDDKKLSRDEACTE
jgi:hypothetical protein